MNLFTLHSCPRFNPSPLSLSLPILTSSFGLKQTLVIIFTLSLPLPIISSVAYFLFKLQNKFKLEKHTTCRAHLVGDGPFVVAIGACMLTSLVFPITNGRHEEDGNSTIDGTDTRFAVIGIVSFIPYFN
ncbi:hypothetical protein QN277_019625 [Acacia crassicarpa]|uniref:Uncharacterized protein n=1 Tax=Acacia crassicarpa TaxID=499986 RepID=A0AAE1JM83_9FABA|nr:hypothetical protein QN277_019625 [Acacia crassicarpa]